MCEKQRQGLPRGDDAMKSGFFDKLVDRLDRLDPESLQTQFLRLASERGVLETIFQSIQEGILVVDGRAHLTYANHAAEQMLGISVDSALGRPVFRTLREIDWNRLLDLDEGEWSRVVTSEIEITYPEHRFLSFYVVPFSPDAEGDKGLLVILRDITRERQEEVTVLESERFNAVKLLAAGVAHEIGNPLNALTIHLQLMGLELGAITEEAREQAPGLMEDLKALDGLVSVARDEVGRLDAIITQFLHAIRPAKPKLALERVDTVLEETLRLLRQEIENRHIEVAIDCPQPLPRIHLDRDQVKQAFFNVIKNAFQAMPDGGALSIGLFLTDEFLGVAFRDTGEGIDSDVLGRIFEPYHTTKAKGSGLGLMVVQRIVQEHGGQLEVASKPGEGSVFTLLLPLAERRVRLLNAPRDGARRTS